MRTLKKFIITLLLLVILAFVGAMGWIAIAPREIPGMTERIQTALNPPDGRFHITIAGTALEWQSWTKPLSLNVQGAKLLSKDNETVATIPSMKIGLNLRALLGGKVIIRNVEVVSPRFRVSQDSGGHFYLGSHKASSPIALREIFLREASQHPDTQAEVSSVFDSGLEELFINNASLEFHSDIAGVNLRIPSADIMVKEKKGIFRGRLDFSTFEQDGDTIDISSLFAFNPVDNHLNLKLNLRDLKLSGLAELDSSLAVLSGAHVPVTGKLELDTILPLGLNYLTVALEAGKGTLDYPELFREPVAVKAGALNAKVTGLLNEVVIEKAQLDLGNPQITLEASLLDTWQEPHVAGKAVITNLTAERLKQLWPLDVGNDAYEWVSEGIVKADVPSALATFDLPMETLLLGELPDEALKLELDVKNATVNYAPGYPEAVEAEGKVTITGDTLHVDVKKAEILDDTRLTAPATVFIPSLAEEEIVVKLDLPVDASAADVATYLKATPYKMPDAITLDPMSIKGRLAGDIHIEVTDKTSPITDEVLLDIKANVAGLSQAHVSKGIDIQALDGTLQTTDKELLFKGNGIINQHPLTLDTKVTGSNSTISAKGVFPMTKLVEFGVEDNTILSGQAGVDMRWSKPAGREATLSGTLDLGKTGIALEEYGFSKPVDVAADMQFSGAVGDNDIVLDSFRLSVPGGIASGSLRIDTGQSRLQEIVLQQFTIGENDLSGTYRPLPEGHYIHLKGQQMDLSFYFEDEEEEKEKERLAANLKNTKGGKTAAANKPPKVKKPRLKRWPDLDVMLDIKALKMKKKRVIHDLKLKAKCQRERCQSFDLVGKGTNTPFFARIGRQKEHRVFTAYVSNLGNLLAELDIFSDVKDGEMAVVGVYQDTLPGSPLVGRITITEHHVRNVPLLAKLLTVATFTGIVDSMSGQGLLFQKTIAPFKWEDFILTLKDAKTGGPSVGITAEGPIDFWDDTIALRGTVVPAHLFNDILSSIPLLGNLYSALAGDGLVAMRYDMRGDLEDPDVSVNPLSALTPGFLRGFFDIFNPVTKEDAERNKKAGNLLDTLSHDIDAVVMELPDFSSNADGTLSGNGSRSPRIKSPTPVQAPKAPAIPNTATAPKPVPSIVRKPQPTAGKP